MKAFITDALVNGKYILPYQIEGIVRSKIQKMISGVNIIAYKLPKSQSLTSTWELRLLLDNNYVIDFSSACTGVGGWQEMGSLNMKFSSVKNLQGNLDNETYACHEITDFCIEKVESLIFYNETAKSESGVIFVGKNGNEIIIAAGCSPGSVSIKMPLDETSFEPEFDLNDYLRESMEN